MPFSTLRESAVVIAAAAAGAIVAAAWHHGGADRCPQPSAASVELLFAPCLAAASPRIGPEPLDPERAPAAAVSPTAPRRDDPGVARREMPGGDVETTGSIHPR